MSRNPSQSEVDFSQKHSLHLARYRIIDAVQKLKQGCAFYYAAILEERQNTSGHGAMVAEVFESFGITAEVEAGWEKSFRALQHIPATT